MGFAFRPGFSIDVDVPSGDLVERLDGSLRGMPLQLRRTRLPGGGADERARRQRDHLVLTVLPDARHFWSPWLTVEVEPKGTGAKVSAIFSPHPSLWTGYMFGYLSLSVIAMFSLIFAGSVAMTGGSSLWSLWVAGGAVLGVVGMWWASQIGQRLAATQMDELHAALDRAVADARGG